jgi:phosphoribosylamine--glycine ligase
MQKVIEPTIKGLVEDGISYTGFLYAGLMIDQAGNPRVLEYNCRSGDPETQPILLRMRTDLADLCMAALAGELHRVEVNWDNRTTLGVVMAARGYPDHYPKGEIIEGIHDAETDQVKVFHAGTAIENGNIITSGGRVLCVTALGDNVIEAQAAAYRSVRRIHWPNAYYRPDIGYHAVAHENT